MVGKLTLMFLLGLFVIPRAFGETAVTAETGGFILLARVPEEDWSVSGIGYGSLVLKQQSSNVKGELAFDCYLFDQVLFDISRAYIKVRFPSFRATMGKTRLSWGEGFFFNAGDVLFDSTDLSPDLTAEVLREDGKWLGAVNVPLGSFSFLEAAVLPPVPALSDIVSGGESYPSIRETTAALRGLFTPGPLQVEGGYAYEGKKDVHKPYISLQGNLLADFNLSAAAALPTSGASWESLYNTLHISFGLFYLFSFPSAGSLSLRLEGLIRPDASWQSDSQPIPPEDHGILLFPEITYAPISSLVFLLRGIFSPVDLSALVTIGADWHITEGLHFLTFTLINTGEVNDLYPYDSPGGFSATCGFRLKS